MFASIAGEAVEGGPIVPHNGTTANFEMKSTRERPDARSPVGAGHNGAPHGPYNFRDTQIDRTRAPNMEDTARLWRVTPLQLLHKGLEVTDPVHGRAR